jgi:RNA polymerase sigma-70 factor (ECF subfamily)
LSRERSQDKAESFLRHLEPLRGALESYARRSLRRPGEVEDVLQAAMTNAYRDFDLYVEGTNFRAWIFRYVNGELLNANRRDARAMATIGASDVDATCEGESWPPPGDHSMVEALRDDPDAVLEHCDEVLARAIRDLPDRERSVLLLRALGEFKYRELAEILGIPLGSVMTSLSRGRGRVRHRLAEFGGERGLLGPGKETGEGGRPDPDDDSGQDRGERS